MTISAADEQALTASLGRLPRGVLAVRVRCPNRWPAVVETAPRLPDGTPFPTLWYLSCRATNAAVSTLESEGLMRQYEERLGAERQAREQYERAHMHYLAARDAIEAVDEIAGFSAGGMPERVKCLHALVAHALAVGLGVNPVGDWAVAELAARGQWPHAGPCVPDATEVQAGGDPKIAPRAARSGGTPAGTGEE